MLKKCSFQGLSWYTDKRGIIICENDIISFDNGHYYRCIIFDDRYCLKCLSEELPLILLDKICINNGLTSGIITKNSNIT